MAKRILAGALLLFALASLVTLVVLEIRARRAGAAPTAAQEKDRTAARDQIVVSYVHKTVRCTTCKGLEVLARDAVTAEFGSELSGGALKFEVADYERPGNERFSRDYGIAGPALLLFDMKDGKVARWKDLKGIWDARETPEKFNAYVCDEIHAFLNEATNAPAGSGAPSAADARDADRSLRALLLTVITAFGLGLLTAISPCPLATNVAAISFLGKRVSSPLRVFLAGLSYSAGRTAAYVGIGVVLVAGLLSTPAVAAFLSKYINCLLGPVLVVVGVFMLELVELSWGGIIAADRLQSRAEKGGLWTAALLGVVFALAFCPLSAALYFGGLIPLCLKMQSSVLLPAAYGLATGLPVVLFALLVAFASQTVGRWFNRLGQIELWMRRVTGVLFVVVGIYFSLIYIYGVFA
jgi:cytochrome c biogenesis protein CcdA